MPATMADSSIHTQYAQSSFPLSLDDEVTPIVPNSRGSAQDYQAMSLRGGTGSEPTRRRKREGSRHQNESSADTPADEDGDGVADDSWWKKKMNKYGAMELDNKGSVARDHLALGECCPRP